MVDQNKIDLSPSYQRNFIWSSNDQKELIDSIIWEMPLPNLFLYERPDGVYEMVDGQQRTTTIYRFVKGKISSSKETGQKTFEELDKGKILDYQIPLVVISDIQDPSILNDYYVRINKKGKHLNTPELFKSEFEGTKFLDLANTCLLNQDFLELDLFTDAVSKRMNDRAYVEELLGYLKEGIRDKKKFIKSIYEVDISDEEYDELKTKFDQISKIINRFNKIKSIKSTRYKQKNDFYTLFSFVNENLLEEEEVLNYQYGILLCLDGTDNEGRQLIRPTNDKCSSLRKYAENCVTQSNSKQARNNRLEIVNNLLKNEDEDLNEDMIEVLNYFTEEFGENKVDLKKVGKYYLLNTELLK